MINKKLKGLLLLIVVSFLLIGVVSATNTDNTLTKADNIVKENKEVDTNVLTKTNAINKNKKDNLVKTATKRNKTKLSLTFNQSKANLYDKVQITATLKDNNNKFIKNQNLTIKIGTKTYKRVTNSKGKVILNYKITNSSVLEKKVIAKYNGNKVYLPSNATKILKSNEEVIYKAKMLEIGKYVDQASDYMDSLESQDFSSFSAEYKYSTNALKKSLNLVNKAIQQSNNLSKYLTNSNRKAFLNLNKKQLQVLKTYITESLNFFEVTKSYVNGKISDSTFDNAYNSFEKKMTSLDNQLVSLDKQITVMSNRYPFLIRGIEKYFK
ncbi:MAG: hypothetical protein BZ138_00270 [Methanosphaera sp. rholeuAM270]|nr:MAG: hypothetical protein BZ138_00270 [Methanosphaera sp. rholeuAM270]